MASYVDGLHSHSGLEGAMGYPKHLVLVDERFEDLFLKNNIKPMRIALNNKTYLRVPIMAFVRLGGQFKNYTE